MYRRVFSLCALALPLFACGGGPSGGAAATADGPVVDVAAGSSTQSAPGEVAGPEDDDPPALASTAQATLVSPDACIADLRRGLGLSPAAMDSPEGALYSHALADEREGRLDHARKGYLSLVQQYPSSPHVPLAYFAFGELFRAELGKDPSKLMLASASYEQILKYPPQTSTVYVAAAYRLADLYRRNGDGPKALSMLKKVLEASGHASQSPCAGSFVGPARAELVSVYAEVGKPSLAFQFFRTMGGGAEPALDMIASLAETYVQTNHPEEAAAALLSAGPENGNDGFCRKETDLLARLAGRIAARQEAGVKTAHFERCAQRR
jgi:tetratricopeptide (TPR) repeat protein